MCPRPKLKREWIGRRVRALRDIVSNGGSRIAKGRICIVRDNYAGLRLSTVRAPHGHVSRVSEDSVQLLPKYPPRERIYCSAKGPW